MRETQSLPLLTTPASFSGLHDFPHPLEPLQLGAKPNVALPSLPVPLSAQPQRPLNHEAVFFRDNTRQQLGFAGTSGSFEVGPA